MSLIEQDRAILNTYNIIQEYGDIISLVKQIEIDRIMDKFGSTKKVVESVIETLKAFPIRFKPSRKELDQAGFEETFDVIMYVSSKEVNDKTIEFDVLRDRIRYQDKELKFKNNNALKQNGHFGTQFRSWILGLIYA